MGVRQTDPNHFAWGIAALATTLLLTLGCSAPESLAGASPDVPEPGGSSGSASSISEVDALAPLPLFIPSFGFDTQTSTCQLSDDPYSTCI